MAVPGDGRQKDIILWINPGVNGFPLGIAYMTGVPVLIECPSSCPQKQLSFSGVTYLNETVTPGKIEGSSG